MWGYCPCTTDAQGGQHWAAFGHGGAVTQLEYAPGDKTSIAVGGGGSNVSGSSVTQSDQAAVDAAQAAVTKDDDIRVPGWHRGVVRKGRIAS